MGTATLHWYSDRGFELDLEAAEDDVAIRLAGIPVPADGTAELRTGVDLDRLDILFKAVVKINGELAQLHDARIQLVDEKVGTSLSIDAKCEDAETGDIVPVRWKIGVALPAGVPVKGGPRPVPANEDDLDWEDETTLEQLIVNAPEAIDDEPEPKPSSRAAVREPEPPAQSKSTRAGKGLQALLRALARDDDEEDVDAAPSEPPRRPGKAASGGKAAGSKASGKASAGKAAGSKAGKEPEVAEPAPKAARTRTRAAAEPKAEEAAKPSRRQKVTPAAAPAPAPRRTPAPPPEVAPDEGPDQSIGADGEARGLLDLLVEGGNLELEEDLEIDGLVAGVKKILSLRLAPEAKASKLSSWLLSQEQVADLFIADDDLAEILERW